jgi:hypothetical protein
MMAVSGHAIWHRGRGLYDVEGWQYVSSPTTKNRKKDIFIGTQKRYRAKILNFWNTIITMLLGGTSWKRKN